MRGGGSLHFAGDGSLFMIQHHMSLSGRMENGRRAKEAGSNII